MHSILLALRMIWDFLVKIWRLIAQTVGGLVILGLVMLVGVGMALDGGSAITDLEVSEKTLVAGEQARKIVVIPLNGEIVPSDTDSGGLSFSSGYIATDTVLPILQHVAQDDAVKAVVLHINSPGGAVVATDELYLAAKQLAARKPLVAVFRDVAASGGYYLAMASHKIVANPATITGSIGVITQTTELTGLYDKVGLQINTFKSGEFKDIGAANRPMTTAEREIIQSIISDSYDQFVAAVVTGRKLDEMVVRNLADGRIMSGKQAQQVGLVDELGTLDRGISLAKDLSGATDAAVVEYQLGGWLEAVLGSHLRSLNPTSQLPTRQLLRPAGLYYLWQ